MVKKPYVPRESKPIERIVWQQEQVNQLTADFTKTVEVLTNKVDELTRNNLHQTMELGVLRQELARCHKERDEFIQKLRNNVIWEFGKANHAHWHCHPTFHSTVMLHKEIDRIAKECFK